jgi:hypothetical protein
LQNEDIATTLVSSPDFNVMAENIRSAQTPLSQEEVDAMAHIRDVLLRPILNHNWEGIEVAKYRRKVAEALAEKTKEDVVTEK